MKRVAKDSLQKSLPNSARLLANHVSQSRSVGKGAGNHSIVHSDGGIIRL